MPSSTHHKKDKQNKALLELHTALAPYLHKKARVFPWRTTYDPYQVFVSEIMLQQTQVDRVIPKFEAFLCAFPSWQALSQASLREVLAQWVGLGYNRRAKFLHDAAKKVVQEFGGILPKDPAVISTLPGVGPYTASAVAAFAYNVSTPFIETNIRTVFTHHCFPRQQKVSDAELLPLIAEALRGKEPRLWYGALMDYGSELKRQGVRLNARSAHYVKQTKFEGSPRQVRGALVRLLVEHASMSLSDAAKHLKKTLAEVRREALKLEKEGLLTVRGERLSGNR